MAAFAVSMSSPAAARVAAPRRAGAAPRRAGARCMAGKKEKQSFMDCALARRCG